MPLDGFTLSFLADELKEKLVGGRVDKITQPERDEIDIMIRNNGSNMTLLLSSTADCARAHITQVKKMNPLEPPMLCMLMRKHITGGRVAGIRQVDSDRILEIAIDHYDELGEHTTKFIICEFMGRHSNIIFTDVNGRIIDSARHVNENMSSVREVLPGLRYEKPPAHGKMPFDALDEQALKAALDNSSGMLRSAISREISGMSLQTASELAFRAAGNEDARIEEISTAAAAASIVRELNGMRSGVDAGIVYNTDNKPIDINPAVYMSRAYLRRRHFGTLSEALDEYYRERDLSERIKQKSAAIHRVLKNNIERCEKKLALQNEALLGAKNLDDYRRFGELITASQGMIKKGQKQCELPDYYSDGIPMVIIPLDVKLSPSQNAQRYFKLYQKARSAQTLAAEQVQKTSEELSYLEGQMENLRKCVEESELSELRSELEKYGYMNATHNRRSTKQLPPSTPMRFTSPDGNTILVGKNNLQNDKLTFTAEANEVWLHAKDIPGSHVIIVGEGPSDSTILFAARLAAKYSKAGAGSNVPIDYTLRKYVKKPSGAKPGFVIYTHQRTLYVDPAEDRQLRGEA